MAMKLLAALDEHITETVQFRVYPRPAAAKLTYATDSHRFAQKLLIDAVEMLGGRHRLEAVYGRVLQGCDAKTTFWQAAIDALGLQLIYDRARLAAIPAEGPIIFIANHPYGLLDGLVMCHFASLVRSDFRILLHSALCREPRIGQYILPIDFDETHEAALTNIETKRRAMELLRQGGGVVIFPAGGISTSSRPFGKVTDLEWKLFTAKMIQMTKATVVPCFFHGHNSRFFQLVSQVSLTLRLAMIIRELNRKLGEPLRVSIGAPLTYEQLAPIKSRQALLLHLRRITYALGGNEARQLADLPPFDRF